MRVIYFHQYFVLPSESGGIRSFEMARRLVRDGHSVDLITTSAMLKGWSGKKSGWGTFSVDGVRVHVLDLSYNNKFGFFRRIAAFFSFALKSTLYALKLDFDLVFATSTPLTIGIPAVFAARWRKKPMVFEVRDLWPEVPIALGVIRGRVLICMAKALEKWIYRHSAHIIALSPGMARGVKRVTATPVDVIPNAADLELFRDPDVRFYNVREKSPGLSSGELIVYTGTIGKVNGLKYLVDVALFLKNASSEYKVVVFGDGAEREAVQEFAERVGVWEVSFFIFPSVPKIYLPSILKQARVAVSTVLPNKTLWDNSANKFFDALAVGSPIAINHGGWLADIIKVESLGVVMDPYDPKEGAASLMRFLNDAGKVERACEASLRVGESEFSREKLYQKFRSVLENVNAVGRS